MRAGLRCFAAGVALASEHLFVCESAFWCGGSCEGSHRGKDGWYGGAVPDSCAGQARGGVLVVRAAGRLVRVDRLSRRTASGAAVLTAFP